MGYPKSGIVQLLSDQDAVGDGSAVTWLGGKTALLLTGTTDGAAVVVQVQAPDGNWVDTQLSLNDSTGLTSVEELPAGTYRASSSGGTDPENLNAWLVGIPQ